MRDIATRPFEQLIDRLGPYAVLGDRLRAGTRTVLPIAEPRQGWFSQRTRTEEKGSGGGAGLTREAALFISLATVASRSSYRGESG